MKTEMITLIFTILLVTFTFNLYAQDCDCEKNFKWAKKTFEENDAGFKYAIETKGKQAYFIHNQLFTKKIASIKTSEECTKAIYEWLTFFRAGHIGIKRIVNNKKDNSKNTPQIIKQKTPEKWESLKVNTAEFNDYLNAKKATDIEGIWESGPYKIGIKKIGDAYVGFIIATSAENWKVGEVKIKFYSKNGVFYLRDKSKEDFNDIKLIGKNYLQLGRFTLKRLSPKFETEKSVETYFKTISSEKSYIEVLNKTTLLFRIPSFNGGEKKQIDSVIIANRDKILHTENLIIDIRNNGGGSDFSYKEIIPFLYTNPIKTIGVEMLSTKLNNNRMLDFVNNPDYGLDAETKKWAKTCYDTLEKHLGKFVNLDTSKISVDKLDTIYNYPKNVGIIINKNNASTAEQFLLAAKQSKKVKLFGTTTFGALDISNMIFVKSPNNEFELGYCLSKSFRIPFMTVDGKGIQPDYFIDSEIKDYDWIAYVDKILNQK